MQQNLSLFGKTYRNLTTISFSVVVVHLQSCVRYSTCSWSQLIIFCLSPTIPLNMLIPQLLRVFCCLKLLYLRTRSNSFLTSTISGHWAQQGWHLLCFSFRVQYCLLLISFSSFQFACCLVKFCCWQME